MKINKSLAVKYRPKTFDEVVEQDSVKLILQEQLKTKTHQNCYLFAGGAGSGKTTVARIFANELNERKGNPIEIDAASNNGVDDVRGIIEDAKFKSLDSLYKVYILDEVHMLSTGAWNAMLKLIEEPPTQTIFIFCTTDPQKIPATIMSRVQRHDFKKITHDSIVERLKYILDEENKEINQNLINYDEESLSYIAKLAEGGMRDAITLLNKCISYNPNITIENVVEALGTVDYVEMLNLTDSLLYLEPENMIILIEELHRNGVDLKQFMKQYSYFILDICKFILLRNFEYIHIPSTYETKLIEYMENDETFFQYLLDNLFTLNQEIKWETNPKPYIEATLLLLCEEDEE